MGKYFFVFILFGHCLIAQKPIWLDTDQLLGNPKNAPREVDDAIALMMALQHKDKVALRGISLVTEVEYGAKITQRVLDTYWHGEQIPIYKGSENCGDVGVENAATIALAEALRKEKLSILAIGPATNIATVLINHPELIPQIKEIAFCAGRTENYAFTLGIKRTIVSDYNFDRDPDAFQVILESGIPVVLSGFECSQYLWLGKTDWEFLKQGSKFQQYLHEHFVPWSLRFLNNFGINGFVPWDTTPLGYFTHPEFFDFYVDIPVHIVEKRNDATYPFQKTEKNTLKKYLEVGWHINSPYKVKFAYKTRLGFEELVIETLKMPVKQVD